MYTAGWASSSSTLTAGRTVTAMLVDAVVLEPASIRRLNATAGHELLVRYMLPNGEIMEKMVPAANLQPTLQRTRRAMAASRLGDESEPPSRSKRRAASSPSAQHSQERSLSKRTHARRILIHSLFTSRSDRWSVGHDDFGIGLSCSPRARARACCSSGERFPCSLLRSTNARLTRYRDEYRTRRPRVVSRTTHAHHACISSSSIPRFLTRNLIVCDARLL